jgi:hypothetical protein
MQEEGIEFIVSWIGEDPMLPLFSPAVVTENVSPDLELACGWPKGHP